MPVLMWLENEDGKRYTKVKTSWNTEFDGEEHRDLAEALDAEIDKVLDNAVKLMDSRLELGAKRGFIRTWSIGRSIATSGILQHEAMQNEFRINLWQAMDQKALLGIRSNGDTETSWRRVRSKVMHATSRPDHHLFEIGLWLQQQEFKDAATTFMGSSGIAADWFTRTVVRSLKMRQAINHWISKLEPEHQQWFSTKTNDRAIIRALAKRWPARGPGSAKRPEHYSQKRLDRELAKTLEPIIQQAKHPKQ